jgi:hypothetical protein
MRKLLVLCFSALSLMLDAQTFNRSYGKAFPWEEITAARTIASGDTLICLYRQRHFNTHKAYLIFQVMNGDGDTLFTRSLMDTIQPYKVFGFERCHLNSNYIGAGFKSTYSMLPDNVGYLVRFNSVGDTLWYKEYVNSDPYYDVLLSSWLYLNDQDQIAQTGWTFHDTTYPYDDTPAQIYLMKTDAQGHRLWDRTYGSIADNESPTDLIGLPGGGYSIQGYTYFNGDPNPPYYHIGSFRIRTDSNGMEVSFNYFQGTNIGVTNSAPTADGNYVIVGTKCNSTIDSCAVALLKIDVNGNILWERILWPDSTLAGISTLEDVLELADGTFIGCGRERSTINGQDAGLVMKMDANGNKIWSRIIDKTPGYDSFTRITSLSDGGILLTGQMQRDQLSDVWLVKIDSLGCDSAGCPLDIHTGITPVVTSSEVETHAMLTAVPNPFTNTTLITFPPLEAGGELVVRDALGRVVLRKRPSAGSTSVEITLRSEPPGLYIASLACTGHQTRSVRLMHEP